MPIGSFVKRNGMELALTGAAVVALAFANYLILRPFLPAMLWAVILTVATWPILLRLRRTLEPRHRLAVLIMVAGLVATVAIPTTLLLSEVIQSAPQALESMRDSVSDGLPPLPGWVIDIPVLGPKLQLYWNSWTANPEALISRLEPYGQQIFGWITGSATSMGLALINLLLTLLLTGLLYLHGEELLRSLQHWSRRWLGTQADALLRIATQTLRGVAIGVVGTALIQSILATAAFAVSGMGHIAILFVLTLMSALVQLGAAPVVALAALWHYMHGETGWAIALAIWTAVVGGLDNVLRPVLIRQGVDLPIWLIFAGVIGGLLAFGVVGLFAGPVILALSYQLLQRDEPKRP